MAVRTARHLVGGTAEDRREVSRGDERPLAGEARGDGGRALEPVEPDGARAGGEVAAGQVEGGGQAGVARDGRRAVGAARGRASLAYGEEAGPQPRGLRPQQRGEEEREAADRDPQAGEGLPIVRRQGRDLLSHGATGDGAEPFDEGEGEPANEPRGSAVAEGEEREERCAQMRLDPDGEAPPHALPQRRVEKVARQDVYLRLERTLAGDDPRHGGAPPQDLGSRPERERGVVLALECLHALADQARERPVGGGEEPS